MINYQNSVVDNYPLYQAFIDLYYAYIKQRNAGVGEVNNHTAKHDIDRALISEVDKFYDVYANNLPQSIAYDKRNLIKILNQLYEAKGTENSIKLLFRLIYNEDIQITYPNDNVLKASDGKWIKEQYFTVHKYSGIPPEPNSRIVFSNESGDFAIITTGLEKIDDNTYRIKFSALDRVYLPMEQIVFHSDGANTYFTGKVIPSPQKLRILKPGKYWKKGKVIVIPGSIRDTVASISNVSSGGVITGVDILEYGVGHQENQISVISPFPRQPTGAIQDFSFEITSVNPAAVGVGHEDHPGLTYHHTIDIEDFFTGLADEVIGVAAGFTHNSYFLSDYLAGDYLGTIEINTSTSPVASIDNVGRETDIQTWQDSLAMLLYEHGSLVEIKGKYAGDEGQLSNQLIKVQDSYFYQAFSYLLVSVQDPNSYKRMADLFHPAGTKRFSGYIKQIDESLPYVFRRAFLIDTIVLREHMSFEDSRPSFQFIKKILETITEPDTIQYKIVVKPLTDPVTPDHIFYWVDIKVLVDTVTYLDINPKTVFKSFVLDSVSTSLETYINDIEKWFTLDSVTPTYTNAKTITKPKADTVIPDHIQYWTEEKVFEDPATSIDQQTVISSIKSLTDSGIISYLMTKDITRSPINDSISISSIDSNGVLQDGTWDTDYSAEGYSEGFLYLTFS